MTKKVTSATTTVMKKSTSAKKAKAITAKKSHSTQNPPEVLTGRSRLPLPSRFTDLRKWADADWKVAKAAAATFTAVQARAPLKLYWRHRWEEKFTPEYERCWNTLPVEGLSPADYFRHCIEKKKKGMVISVTSKNMKSQFVATAVTAPFAVKLRCL